jgi:hypothetical protein
MFHVKRLTFLFLSASSKSRYVHGNISELASQLSAAEAVACSAIVLANSAIWA